MKKLIGMVLVSALLLTAQPLVFGAENHDNLVSERANVAGNSSIYTSSDTGIQATASYSSRYNKVSVVGKCADVSGAAVNIFIIPEDEDIASLSDRNLPSAVDSVITTTGGDVYKRQVQ